MLVEKLRKDKVPGGGARISADVTWEDYDAPAETVFIETTDRFAEDLEPSPDAFLTAMFPLAQWRGERRVQIEGSVCCRLRDGLDMATQIFGSWFDRCGPLRFEPTAGFRPTTARSPGRAACFLSGGVDALSLFRANRLDYPADHPGSIRDCVVVFGLNTYDIDASGPRPERVAVFDAHVKRMTSFADHTGATLIPMNTNIRAVYSDFLTWGAVGFGPGIIATALCLARRIDTVQMGSDGLGILCPPGSTHPVLDHQFSTEAVRVYHAQPGLARLEKVRLVSDWPEGLSVLRSCFYHNVPEGDQINCGKCEKCLRTMLALLALGKLEAAKTFPFDDIDAGMLDTLEIADNVWRYYEQCLAPLEALGRSDLTVPLRTKLDGYLRSQPGGARITGSPPADEEPAVVASAAKKFRDALRGLTR